MTLLNPTWLFALAAVIIPVLIHLWNIRNGKVLKVGSVSLITASSRKSSRSLNLLDLLLLLLRCLLLILLALLLATPIFKQSNTGNKVKGWVLIPKQDFREAYFKFKSANDSLTDKGYEFHYFDKGFAKADIIQQLASKNIYKADSLNGKPISYNALLSQLQRQLPAGLPVVLFTNNRYNRFSDERLPVALNLQWKVFTPADSVRTWLQSAWFSTNKDIIVIEGKSTPWGTSYGRYSVKPGENDGNPFEVVVKDGKSYVSLKNDKQSAIPVEEAVYKIAVYADNFGTDAHYLEAALNAGLAFIPHNTSIKTYETPETIPAGEDWVFWLSEKPVPVALKQHTRHLLTYVPGKAKAAGSWIDITSTLYASPEPQIALFKVTDAPKTGEALWKDGFGDTLLSFENQDSTANYHFYSHFNPEWNNLVWSNEFPEILLKLITDGEKQSNEAGDRRAIAPRQLPPVIGANGSNSLSPLTLKNYSNYIWLALVVLFLTERWLAHRKKTVQLNGGL